MLSDHEICDVTVEVPAQQEVNHLLKTNYMELTDVLDESLEGTSVGAKRMGYHRKCSVE